MNNLRISLVTLLSFLLLACNSQNASVHNLNANEFGKAVLGQPVQLIDVRTPGEYADKHIPNSKNLNVNDATFEKSLDQLDKNKPIYIYCLSGGRSANASNMALKKGFKEVYNLEGGITAWIGSKQAIEYAEGNTPAEGLNMDDYLKRVKSNLVLVDFNAIWCGPCKVLKPIVKQVVANNSSKVELFDIDVDKNPSIANAMNIRQIPLLILYKEGKEVWRQLGVTDEETLTALVNKYSK